MEPTESYPGIRPYARDAAERCGCVAVKVERNRSVKKLDGLLRQADNQCRAGKADVARATLEAAREGLVELQAGCEAAEAAFAAVEGSIKAGEADAAPPGPGPDGAISQIPPVAEATSNVAGGIVDPAETHELEAGPAPPRPGRQRR